MNCKNTLFGTAAFTLIIALFFSSSAYALSTIRDAEIEHAIRDLGTPIFKAAGLVPENINLILVSDPQINAYVAGGMNLFINTGLLLQFDKPEVIQGVMAHESGHIAGGHLARNNDLYKNITMGSIISYGLGAITAALGSPQAGIAIMQGGSQIAQREALQYSRQNEDSADEAGLKFLDKTGNTASGLLELLQYLNTLEHDLYGAMNPYTLTHPLSRQRILHIQNHVMMTHLSRGGTITPAIRTEYARSIIKLHAFFEPVDKTLKKYPPSTITLAARYARAIAYQKIPDLTKSFYELDRLLKDYPHDPYFNELKGQILFENGHASDAVSYYTKAVETLPNEPLLELGLAMAQIGTADNQPENSKALLESAAQHLSNAHLEEPSNLMVLEQLEIAYGKSGQKGMAYLTRAEQALLTRNKDEVKRFAALAEKFLPAGSPSALRARDIEKANSDKQNK